MAKKSKKKTVKAIKSVIQKQKYISWFAGKLSQRKVQAHQLDEIKSFFQTLKLDIEQEEMGNYDKAFKRF